MKPTITFLLFCLLSITANAQAPWSRRMADSFIARNKDSILVGKSTLTRWDYEQGLMLKAIEKVWYRTGEGKYFEYIRKDLDQYVKEDGSIRTYKLDDLQPG